MVTGIVEDYVDDNRNAHSESQCTSFNLRGSGLTALERFTILRTKRI